MAEVLGSLRLAAISAGAKYQESPIAKATRNIVVCTIPPGIRHKIFGGSANITHFFAASYSQDPGFVLSHAPHSTATLRTRGFARISALSLRHGRPLLAPQSRRHLWHLPAYPRSSLACAQSTPGAAPSTGRSRTGSNGSLRRYRRHQSATVASCHSVQAVPGANRSLMASLIHCRFQLVEAKRFL